MDIYFNVDTTCRYRYQELPSFQSMHEQISKTLLNDPIVQSTTTIGNSTPATSYQSNIKSSNTYNHNNYESLTQGNIQSFIAIFQQVKLFIDYVISDNTLNHTKFNMQKLKYLILCKHTVLIVVMEQYDQDLIITLLEIGYKIKLLSMVITKVNTEQ